MTAVAIVVPAVTASNSGQSEAQRAKTGVRAQPRVAYEQGGQTVWWAGSRLMY